MTPRVFPVLALLTAFVTPARAAPQVSVGLTLGADVRSLRAEAHPPVAFHMGGRADMVLLRSRGSDMGIGPYVDIATNAFDTLELGAGALWLIPVRPEFPLVWSVGAFERRAPVFGWEPGVASTLFWGSRSYNFHSWYGLCAGFFVQGRYGLGDARQAEVIGGVQLDTAFLALPFMALVSALRR
ncbi:MAG: hypothetical protein WCI05_09115 [Myxococcales bacterium]